MVYGLGQDGIPRIRITPEPDGHDETAGGVELPGPPVPDRASASASDGSSQSHSSLSPRIATPESEAEHEFGEENDDENDNDNDSDNDNDGGGTNNMTIIASQQLAELRTEHETTVQEANRLHNRVEVLEHELASASYQRQLY